MNNINKKIIIFSFFAFLILPAVALAQNLEFAPPLGETDIKVVIARVIRAVLGVIGSIALLMFFIGGFMWLTAGGNADRIKRAKDILIWSILGLVVIFSAYAIVQFVITALLE